MTLAEHSLGSKLKGERESRGFTLDEVSASTKIPVTLLEALERDDLSRWPKGLYRRAFFRSYLTTLGLPPEPLAGEFARLFPDEPSLESPPAVVAPARPQAPPPNELLARMLVGPAAERVWRSVAVALVEVAAVLAAGRLVGWAAGMTLLTASGAVALIYYPLVRAAAGRVGRSANVTRRSAASIAQRAQIPSAETGALAATTVPHSAPQRIRSGLARARIRLAHLGAHSARKWLPRAKRITTTANDGLWRAVTRTGRVLSHGAEVTFQLSSRFVIWTTLLLWRAGTRTGRVLRHGVESTFQLSSRFVIWTTLLLRRAGTRTERVLSHGAEVTFQVSSRFIRWTSLLLWRAGTRTGRVLTYGTQVTFQVSSRFVTWTSLRLSGAGTGSRRALEAAAKQTSRVFLRVLRAVNHAFWTGVRAAAEHAELFAARRLDRKGE